MKGGQLKIGYICYILYIYLFHPRYLHNDIFRYMTCEITHDVSRCYFTRTGEITTMKYHELFHGSCT